MAAFEVSPEALVPKRSGRWRTTPLELATAAAGTQVVSADPISCRAHCACLPPVLSDWPALRTPRSGSRPAAIAQHIAARAELEDRMHGRERSSSAARHSGLRQAQCASPLSSILWSPSIEEMKTRSSVPAKSRMRAKKSPSCSSLSNSDRDDNSSDIKLACSRNEPTRV